MAALEENVYNGFCAEERGRIHKRLKERKVSSTLKLTQKKKVRGVLGGKGKREGGSEKRGGGDKPCMYHNFFPFTRILYFESYSLEVKTWKHRENAFCSFKILAFHYIIHLCLCGSEVKHEARLLRSDITQRLLTRLFHRKTS